jgi:hypothetical protein
MSKNKKVKKFRESWTIRPVTKIKPSGKIYSRKKGIDKY